MNHKDRRVGIDHKNYLKHAAGLSLSPHQIFLIFLDEWKRSPGAKDDIFRFLGRDAVLADVFDVPAVSSEVQLVSRINYIINTERRERGALEPV